MVRDFKINRENAEKNESTEEIENVPVNSNEYYLDQPTSSTSGGSRVPLHSIRVSEPTVKSKTDSQQEAFNKTSRVSRTPTKVKGKTVDHPALPLRTPDKAVNVAKSRFGWSSVNEGRSDMANYLSQSGKNAGGGAGSLNLTPRVSRTTNVGRTPSWFSEAGSTQTTPTKSVSKPPNPGFGSMSVSRYTGNGSLRGGSYAALPRGTPSHNYTPPAVVNMVEVPHFDLKEDPSFWMDHNVQVIIRVRPLNSMERSTQGYNRCVRQESGQTITWTGQPETRFTFDHVACETVDQEMLFRMAGLPMVENCLSGYNSCMFAYGQTGSGKTYTMLGEIEDLEFKPSLNRGMTPRIFEFLFARIRAEEESRRDEKLKYSCKCSFLEIYNEQITDLLDPSSTNLLLREDVRKGVYVENLSEVEVQTVGDIVKLLAQGSANRKVAATNMNRESSRSHSVFTCVIESKWDRDSSTNLRFARLNLVDLAGSERQKTSGAEGGRLKEAANINKSLSTLGHVIMVLVDLAQGKPKHVPYRDSRLTFLLQDSLGGNSKTMIIANISPSICCAAETLNTLKFAQRAKFIQNNAVVNEDSSGDVVALQHQIRVLKEELCALKHHKVSRPLLFVPASLEDPATVSGGGETEKEELDVSKGDDMLGCEPNGSVMVSSKQYKAMETILAGALRREQMAETSIKQLEAEIEQLNRLVHQREEDSRCTKMMLKFREDKIHKMESFLNGSEPVDAYLLEENTALSEQIQLLRVKLDKNPEVTRFALENIRLLEQLRRFQDFYEEGEREILLKEVSELRDQLIQFLDGNATLQSDEKLQIPPQEATNRENDTLHFELKKAHNDLEECQSKLKSCLESNAKLSREIIDLQALLKNKNSAACLIDSSLDGIKESIIDVSVQPTLEFSTVQNKKHGSMQESRAEHAEEMVNLQLELDILKIILKEERLSREKLEERVSCLNRDINLAEESFFLMNNKYDSLKEELQEAKSVIEALESQQLMSMKELDDLRTNNFQKSELSRKQELEQISGVKCNCELAIKHSEHVNSPLQAKLNKMQVSLDMAKQLNELYHDDHAFNQASEKEIEEVRRQAEAETAEVIVCLQEELSTLQLQVQNSTLRESETKSRLLLLETQISELQDTLDSMSQDNEALHEQFWEKEREMKSMLKDWEVLGDEIESVLTDGHETLVDTSDELDGTSSSVSRSSRWISEQVGKVVRQVSEKEFLIKELQKHLETAESKRNNVECMLRSLKGAALVITESHQKECYANEREILQLRSELSAKISTIAELENRIKLGQDQMRKASSCAIVAFLLVNRLSEMKSNNQAALRLMGDQLTESVEISERKDIILNQQTEELKEAAKEIQGLKGELKLVNDSSKKLRHQLEDQENCVSELRKRLQVNEAFDIQQTKEKLSELKNGVSSIQSRVNECVEQAGNLCRKSNYKIYNLDDDNSNKSLDNGRTDQEAGEVCWHSEQNMSSDTFECIVKEPDNVIMESMINGGRQDSPLILLRKEIESALEGFKGVETEISCLRAEKEEIYMSERQGCCEVEVLRDQVLNLQVMFNDFEEQCGHRLLSLYDKVRRVEKCAHETDSIWQQRRELFESQLDDARMVAAQKTAETSRLFARFEEAQDMIKEADVMINGLMIANETLKLQIKELKDNEIVITHERDSLAQEIMSLRSSNESKIQQYELLEEQCELDLKNIGSIIQELEVFIEEINNSNKEEFMDLAVNLQCIKFRVGSTTNSVRSWLEDVWSEIVVKDTSVSVLHLCHMGGLLEAISGLNAENSLLHRGLSESNAIICSLREHNMDLKHELDTRELLNWKLLADIKNSFDCLQKKDETGKLDMKLSSFEQKISDHQLRVESMFESSNYIVDELANIANELNSSHSNVAATLLEQENLLRDSEDIIITQDENYMMGLCTKEFGLLILSSEMKELAHQQAAVECEQLTYHSILECMKEKIVTLGITVDFKEQLLFEMETEITALHKQVEEVHGQLTQSNALVAEKSRLNDVLKKEIENLNDKLTGELYGAREDKVTLVSQIDELQKQLEDLSMNLLLKGKECEHLSSRVVILDDKNQKLQNDISLHVCSSEKFQKELLVKNAKLSKYSCLDEESEMLRKKMHELEVEQIKLSRDLEEKESEVMSSTSCIELLNSEKSALQEMVQRQNSEKVYLQKELHILEGKLDAAEALIEEKELIAAEAQQVAESRRVYAQEKEEEVMLLENSVQELDSTINVLENKVDMLQGEAERQRLQREELELELQSLKHQLHSVKSADVDIERHLDEKDKSHQEALMRIQTLEKDLANKESEIVQCKKHISELNLHAEVQASEYKKKFKTLEAMAEHVKPERHSSHGRNSPASKLEKNASKGRGSGSPFKCIGLGLAQQLKSENDEELTADKVRIEELEALAASRQKEIFMLNARLASAESMTHDVIRDLLGVKLDMSNYVSLLNNEQPQEISDKVQLEGTMSFVKDKEVSRLKQQLNEFIEERQGWLEEIDRKQAELVAAQLALEKLRQRDQLVATENDILKMEISNHKKKTAELEGEVKQLSDQQNLQQRIHHHAKIKEENNVLRVQNEDLSARLRRAETILSRVREELSRYRASSGRSTYINFDEEKRLNNMLKKTEEERLHLAQKLVGLCTSILKAAGITKPVAQINLSAAQEALEHLGNHITYLERELDDMKFKNKLTTERIRLSELIPQSSPLSVNTEGNCRTPRRGTQSPYFSAFDR